DPADRTNVPFTVSVGEPAWTVNPLPPRRFRVAPAATVRLPPAAKVMSELFQLTVPPVRLTAAAPISGVPVLVQSPPPAALIVTPVRGVAVNRPKLNGPARV